MDQRIKAMEEEEKIRHNQFAVQEKELNVELALDPEAWLRFDGPEPPSNSYFHSVKSLGEIKDRRILDFGCGTGELSTVLAKRGAKVIGFDISFESISRAKRRAKTNGISECCSFFVASAHALPLRDESVDLIIGQAILHHLDPDLSGEEIDRILHKKSLAIFHEAYGASRTLQLIRKFIPVKYADDSLNPRPQLSYEDIQDIGKRFRIWSLEEFQIFSRLDRITRNKWFLKCLGRVDAFLLRRFAYLRRFARYAVITLQK